MVVNMAPGNYNALLDKLAAVYALLKNGIVIHHPEDTQDRLIQIPCDMAEAEMLLYCAREFCPKAASQLEEALGRPTTSLKPDGGG